VSADGPGLYLDPAFGRGLDLVASMGLTFDASVFHPPIPDVAALARSHPDASIVLIHTGSPLGHASYAGREADVHADWLAAMTELATCPNVTVKLGGLLMCLGSFDFTTAPIPPSAAHLAAHWRPYLEPCIELFGAGRCMVASNSPSNEPGSPTASCGTPSSGSRRRARPMRGRCSSAAPPVASTGSRSGSGHRAGPVIEPVRS
jgi:predicted TIM-barrel fold metal-dependent hydrolase